MPGVAFTLRAGDRATVATPNGIVTISCVREEAGRVRVLVEAPASFEIERQPRQRKPAPG